MLSQVLPHQFWEGEDKKSPQRRSQIRHRQTASFFEKNNMSDSPRRSKRKKVNDPITHHMKAMRFSLEIETTNTLPNNGPLLNRFEAPDSRIKRIRAVGPGYYDSAQEDHIPYTLEQLKDMPGYTADRMVLINDETKFVKVFIKEGGFSCLDVIKNIVAFEKRDRPNTEWFDGIDCHHIYYEGMRYDKKTQSLRISWGS